jgi:hypothetical protein
VCVYVCVSVVCVWVCVCVCVVCEEKFLLKNYSLNYPPSLQPVIRMQEMIRYCRNVGI